MNILFNGRGLGDLAPFPGVDLSAVKTFVFLVAILFATGHEVFADNVKANIRACPIPYSPFYCLEQGKTGERCEAEKPGFLPSLHQIVPLNRDSKPICTNKR
jgi:hypothetical protein